MKWRLVLFEKVATLQEVEEYWDFKDLIDANSLMDTKLKITEFLIKEAKADGKENGNGPGKSKYNRRRTG